MAKEKNDFQHLTLLQIQYLRELKKVEKKRGMVARIAQECGGSHGPVSMFLKECCKNGYLTEDYEFTEYGKKSLEGYEQIIRQTEAFLDGLHLPQGLREDTLRALIGNVDYSALMKITRSGGSFYLENREGQRQAKPWYFLMKVLTPGETYEVPVVFHRIRGEGEARARLSMADRGFCHTATIKNNKRAPKLELRILDIYAYTRDGKSLRKGRLNTLKYPKDGNMKPVQARGRKLELDLRDFRYRQTTEGMIQGYLPVTVTCTVGDEMPESTAVLSFYL